MHDKFKIRFANYSDKKNIMFFIGQYWDKDHILSKDNTFFNFQYYYKKNLQFVLATGADDKIVGILGYIQYFPEYKKQDVALALWKVIPNLPDPLLGLKLILYLKKNLNYGNIFCVGINKNVTEVYKFIGFKIDELLHFVAFNKNCKEFKISTPPQKIKSLTFSNNWSFKISKNVPVSLENLFTQTNYIKKIPFKPKEFIIKRYLNHPYFTYNFHEVFENNFFMGLVISREVNYSKRKALRIIDILSEDKKISEIINEFANILNQSHKQYEYVDVYVSNININFLTKRNYNLVSNSSKIIVPDYFSPFIKQNIKIFFCSIDSNPICLFKGDGDQDNPRKNIN